MVGLSVLFRCDANDTSIDWKTNKQKQRPNKKQKMMKKKSNDDWL